VDKKTFQDSTKVPGEGRPSRIRCGDGEKISRKNSRRDVTVLDVAFIPSKLGGRTIVKRKEDRRHLLEAPLNQVILVDITKTLGEKSGVAWEGTCALIYSPSPKKTVWLQHPEWGVGLSPQSLSGLVTIRDLVCASRATGCLNTSPTCPSRFRDWENQTKQPNPRGNIRGKALVSWDRELGTRKKAGGQDGHHGTIDGFRRKVGENAEFEKKMCLKKGGC